MTHPLIHPQFDPVAFHVFGWPIHWYGLTYLAAFGLFLWLANVQVSRPWNAQRGWTRQGVDDLLFFGVLGVVLGGRMGYVLFYKPGEFLKHPLDIFAVWQGGMSFHGGLLGVIVALAFFGWRRGFKFFEVADLVAPCVPTGLAMGRLGNFINGELWGRPADASVPWAMIFPQAHDQIPRHPSQIYQFLGEGVLLFIILWLFSRKPRPMAAMSGLFLIGYGAFRFAAEYFREPDEFLGLRWFGWSQGQWLSAPMVVAGLLMMIWAYRRVRGVGTPSVART
ncbi:prolipoprotein diacylglyceryl transferase [Roseateles sp. SL47]|jgi:phosphatidylglycerol---prolipoprotein diacylglyceryl transferase|uniref:prolipoprotein diacylglyceryl transferase n=1 Tax=Roseateles sp. SL47 TaxID=2995138 RepID=UPI00226FDB29|nr:prolipoprotein diacylglyceryl transferase [Roseateles sp. SL47]WAC71143.1 prolipoprotein diacylglyceryl transferase [Roseateles sp. SL47]